MSHFRYRAARLHCEEVPLDAIAREVGTPCYVYSHAALSGAFDALDRALGRLAHLICYGCKANGSLAVIRALAARGAGTDITSGGELYRSLAAGVPPRRIVYSGVGKGDDEIAMALEAGILGFNVESPAELEVIDAIAGRMGRRARVALRVNPDVDPRTHPYIATGLTESKFGIPLAGALEAYRRALALRHLAVVGVDCHIGSQLRDLAPLAEAYRKLRGLALEVRALGAPLEYVDVGGGIGIAYREGEAVPTAEAWAQVILDTVGDLGLTVVVEPGRLLVGGAGVLLTRVLYTKVGGETATGRAKRFVVVDAGMNDLLRPSLYQAHHEIRPVAEPAGAGGDAAVVDVVGPICESADFLARARPLPPVERGALLAVMDAGAYGFAMASNYNGRPRAAEVLVHGREFAVIRQRERHEDLVRGEVVPPFLSDGSGAEAPAEAARRR